jgi:hypothetical protein
MPRKKKNFEDKVMETFDIKERIIFSAGVHNGDLYTEDDLAQIEIAFNECKGKLRPPLKLGHNELQELWQNDGMPSIGWIDNVKKVGADLVADFIKVPKTIYELITAGAYRTVSAEIYWNAVIEGKKYPYALKALALLGADIPAVKSVSDILSLYKAEAMAYAELDKCEVKTYEGSTPDKEIDMENKTPEVIEEKKEEVVVVEEKKEEVIETPPATDTKPNLEEVVAKLERVVETLSQKKTAHEARIAELSEKLTTAEKNYADATDTIKKGEEAKKYADLEAKVNSLIVEKKLMPAQKEPVMKLLSEIPLGKSYKEGELDTTVESLLFSIFKANAASSLNTKENSEAGAPSDATDEMAQINKISKDKGISYKDAYLLWKNKK